MTQFTKRIRMITGVAADDALLVEAWMLLHLTSLHSLNQETFVHEAKRGAELLDNYPVESLKLAAGFGLL